MFALSASAVGTGGSRTKQRVSLLSTTAVTTMPTSGADVINMADDVTFDTGSTLLVTPTAEMFFYGEDNQWHLFGEGA